MACNLWEEMGLLYSSDELNEQEGETFTAHIRHCSECAHELETYQHERQKLFSIDVLGEAPSAACDAEILRVCSNGRRQPTNLSIISLFIKKSAIGLALFLMGFTIVGYLVFRADVSDRQKTVIGNQKEVETTAPPATPVTEAALSKQQDTLADSAQHDSVNFANRRGNLDINGAHPVDQQIP